MSLLSLDQIKTLYNDLRGRIEDGGSVINFLPVDNASGSIASFPDGADNVPVKSLIAQITPLQDLHGQSAPYPAGGGKNKFQTTATTATVAAVLFTVNSDGSVKPTRSGSSTANASLLLGTATLPAGSYLVNGGNAVNDAYMTLRDGDTDAFIANITDSDYALTVTEEHSYKLVAVVASDVTPTGTLKPMIRLASDTDATFAPYSNVCPISGWTGAKISVDGVNVWDEETQIGYYNSSGTYISDGTVRSTKNITLVKPSTAYALVVPVNVGNGNRVGVCEYDASGTFLRRNQSNTYTKADGYVVYTTSADCYGIRVNFEGAYGATYNNDISINYPSTDTSYHAYNGATVNIDWTDEGAVYGGTLTYIGGGKYSLQDIYKGVTLTGAEAYTWTASGAYQGSFYTSLNNFGFAKRADGGEILACSHLKPVPSVPYAIGNIMLGAGSDNNINMWFADSATLPDAAAFKAYLAAQFAANTPVQIVARYATLPDPIILDGEDVKTLLGDNNIFVDTGDVSVDYRADIALYIQKVVNA